jgi:hypothetical protein
VPLRSRIFRTEGSRSQPPRQDPFLQPLCQGIQEVLAPADIARQSTRTSCPSRGVRTIAVIPSSWLKSLPTQTSPWRSWSRSVFPSESLAGRILVGGLQATVVARCSRRQYEALQLRNHNPINREDYQRYLLVRFGLPGPRTTRKIASSRIGLRINKPWILST